MAESASLYRRHRPQSFDEVVGQKHVVRTLRNAVEQGRVHHAYLFVGSRGTGKTSMAKILARSLNCVHGPTPTPCGECEPCRAIAGGTSLDVIEMDAASNRSVDDVRDLRERVGYAPAQGRWKVYILDEAHMLTKEAWNAFLKTLEEPPPNTVFVLATTEPQRVMPTIVDRCQRFDFQRPSLEQISEVVRRVAAAEGIEIEHGAVALISRAAAGSFRDALGTVDQLVAFGGGEKVAITTDAVIEVLGAADAELLFDVADAIIGGDVRGILGAVERLVRSGRDPGQFARDLIAHLRQLLVIRVTGSFPEAFTVTAGEPGRLAEQAARAREAKLVGAIDSLSAAVAAMREGDDPRFSLEVALIRVAQPRLDPSREALLRRIEDLEGRIGGGAVAGPTGAGSDSPAPTPAPTPPPSRPGERGDAETGRPPDAAEEGDARSSRAEAPPPAEAVALASPASPEIDLDRVARLWPAIIDNLRESSSEMLSSLFEGARPLAVDAEGAVLRIGFPPSARFNKRKAESEANVERITESVQAIVGARLRPSYELLDSDSGDGAAARSNGDRLAEEEIIELLKASFDALEVDPGSEPGEAGKEAG